MSSTQNPFEDPIHGAPATGIRGMLRGLSVRQQEKSQEKKAARLRTQNWTLPDSGECKSWSLEESSRNMKSCLRSTRRLPETRTIWSTRASATRRRYPMLAMWPISAANGLTTVRRPYSLWRRLYASSSTRRRHRRQLRKPASIQCQTMFTWP